jgi:hypothetical protein
MDALTSERITFVTGTPEVSSSNEVERIAQFIERWALRKHGHPDCAGFCEDFGCSSFKELATDIREQFGAPD